MTITEERAAAGGTEGTAGTAGSGTYPTPARPDDGRFVGLAAEVGAVAAAHAAEHDRDASFVFPAYEAMRETGYLRLAVPEDLGGLGATLRQACYAQAELARHDGAAALAVCMHLYNAFVQVFRRRAGAPDAEGVLRRVAEEDLVIAASGGSDWLWPSTVAVEDGNGGFRVSGRKVFVSQSPAATVVSTSAVLGEPGPGAEVLHFSVPLAAEGVRLDETWDTLGMRGTASHDLVLDEVAVPGERIVGRRPWGELGPPLRAAVVHFAPLGGATYYGIAASARDVAVRAASERHRGPKALAELPRVQRQVGQLDADLRVAWWALMASLDEAADDDGTTIRAADPATVNTLMLAKREAVMAAIRVVDGAMDVLGGRSYFRSGPLERALRDVRAGTFHPFTPEATLAYAGQLALGGDGTTE